MPYTDAEALVASGARNSRTELVDPESLLVDTSDAHSASNKPKMPVVVILGHYDHGKTTLLDALGPPGRHPTDTTNAEPAGITQAIRTRRVHLSPWLLEGGEVCENISTPSNKPFIATFVDTPGQEMFHRLRLNGALAADCALLVVDAREGISSQASFTICATFTSNRFAYCCIR